MPLFKTKAKTEQSGPFLIESFIYGMIMIYPLKLSLANG